MGFSNDPLSCLSVLLTVDEPRPFMTKARTPMRRTTTITTIMIVVLPLESDDVDGSEPGVAAVGDGVGVGVGIGVGAGVTGPAVGDVVGMLVVGAAVGASDGGVVGCEGAVVGRIPHTVNPSLVTLPSLKNEMFVPAVT